MSNIILCADDYAQNQAISEGIVKLLKHGRINATSCMVNAIYWKDASQALQPLQATCFVGLHFNLSHGEALSSAWKQHYGATLPGMPYLLKQTLLRRLNPAVVSAEIQAQLDAYTQGMNAYPDFIDGHQHIHQLPVIREALFDMYTQLPSGVFIRKTTNGWRDLVFIDGFPKRQIISMLGGLIFEHQLAQRSIPCNTSFSGIYDFKRAPNYRHYFKQFLNHSQEGGLIMCHPGNPSNDARDPLHAYRYHELNYLMSDAYLNDLARVSFQLNRKQLENYHD